MKKKMKKKDLEEVLKYIKTTPNFISTRKHLIEQLVGYLNNKYKEATITWDSDKETINVAGSDEDKTLILEEISSFQDFSAEKD